ncbi:hypothetical protein [Streptomyces chryseus]|uniref:hypothetical protein n=1 Tax=Streptomyces chryseus TaxID=68186 RepID=UPI00110FA7C3|nr:hypothetical protein [Streptomyces chryseus]
MDKTRPITTVRPQRLSLGVGVYTVRRWLRERWLRRHGITVTATAAAPPGAHVYMDDTGTHRGLLRGEDGPYVTVSHDPRDPADALLPQAPHLRLLNSVLGSFLLFCSLSGMALLVLLVVDAFTGGEFTRGADGVQAIRGDLPTTRAECAGGVNDMSHGRRD